VFIYQLVEAISLMVHQLPIKPVQIGSGGLSSAQRTAPQMVHSMLLRKFWPLLLIISSSVPSVAATDFAAVRVSDFQVPLAVHERRVWASALRDSKFTAVPHTMARASCEAASAPEPLATPNPLLETPDLKITISVSFIIGTDGRVHSPLILASAGTAPDRKVLNAVRTWRYRPALCNGVPTETEGKVEFSSH
jgi:TonB family protein